MNFGARSRTLLASCIALLGCSFWGSAQAAGQEDRLRFKDFRQQNPDLNRHMVRRMFQIEKKAGETTRLRSISDQRAFAMQAGTNGTVQFGSEPPRLNNRDSGLRNQSVQMSNSGLVRLQSGVNLDLTSEAKNIVLGENLFAGVGSVSITVGGESKTVSAGSQVTAAEYVAAKQVLSGGNQSVVVNARGAASGGSVDFGALTNGNDVMKATDLVIAPKVTAYGDFGKHSDFRLTGDLTNYGNLELQSSDLNVRGGAVRADDITNHSGAKISSAVDLTLEATRRLNNFGVISSDQNLTLASADSVNNTGSLKANGNIDLNSAAINNSGVIRSSEGSINLNGVADATLSVNNTSGILNAANGAINLRNAAYSGTFDSTIYGGDLLSKELNMHSGNGAANVRVDALSGLVNQTGSEAHVLASTEELNIGTVCLTGDPTIFNTAGGINITANLIVSENLAIIAAGNITSSPGVTISSRDASQQRSLYMVAGAEFTPDGGQDSPTVPPIDPQAPADVTLTGNASKSGGGIFLGTGTIIDTRPTGPNGRGGEVVLVAFGSKAGVVDVSEATILAGGAGTGINGFVSIIAGAKSGDSIQVGTVNLLGGTGAGDGSLSLSCAQPKAFDNTPISFDADGTRLDGRFSLAKQCKANAVFLDSAIGPDVQGNGVSAFTYGNITVGGDIVGSNGVTFVTLFGGIAPLSDTSGSVTGNIVLLQAGKDIGKVVDPTAPIALPVTTNQITATTDGDFVAVDILGSGALNIVDTKASSRVIINAPQKVVSNIGNLSTSNVELTVFDTVNVPIQSYTSFTLNTLNPSFVLTGQAGNVGTVTLFSAGGIGTSVNPFQFNSVGVVNATSSGDIRIAQQTQRQTTFDLFSTNGSIYLTAGGDLTIKGAAAPAGSIQITENKPDGTMIFRNATTARDFIDIIHTGDDPKSKIIFASDSTIDSAYTLGGIGIFLGPGSQPIISNPVFDNVQIVESGGGTVGFQGSGISAKKPVNILTAKDGGSITITNAYKAKNLSLGGNVKITADP